MPVDELRFCRCSLCGGPGRVRRDHPQIHIVGTVQQACVDEMLAPLLRYLWAGGCLTVFSCQASRRPGDSIDWAHITFADGHSFDAGLQLLWQVYRGYDPTLKSRIANIGSVNPSARCAWEHGMFVHHEPWPAGGWLRARHVLRLPTDDVITITRLVSNGDNSSVA